MTAKNEISEELRMLSGVVAGISRVTPFEAPGSGYFQGFAALVLSRVSEASGAPASGLSAASGASGSSPSVAAGDVDLPLPAVLQGITKSPFSGVPTGYFDDLASRVLDRIRSSAAAQAMADGDTGSFDGTGTGAIEELSELSPLLAGIGKKLPFQVPEGYFNTLTARLPGERRPDESGEPGEPGLSTLMAGLQSITPYQAPQRYFEQFPDQMLAMARATGKEEAHPAPAKVISIGRKQGWWKLPAVAVAASVILVVGWLGLHTSLSKPGNAAGNPDITKSLSNATVVSDQEILNYMENQQNIPLADQLAGSVAADDISDSDFNGMLGDLSDTELKQYMEDHGDAKDLPTN